MITKFIYGFFGIIALFLIALGKAACDILPTLWKIFKAVAELTVHLIVVAITSIYEIMCALIS